MNSLTEFLQKLLNGFVDQFKMKNATAYTIIVLIIGGIYYLASQATSAMLPDDVTPLLAEAARKTVEVIQNIAVVALALLGAHTPGSNNK